ncbi:type II toxin-antitoxin system PemK/MazF family toxin [Haloferax denitrificans]|nr:type II toxin-antitoxin system PemK/MazF family toxin [Haloferax denitrificans]
MNTWAMPQSGSEWPRLSVEDVVIVELTPTQGSEQRETRPCLVVQNNVGNANAPTTIVVPFTTSFGEQLYPFEVLVPAEECALREDSVALCSQVRTVSIEHRITENIGSIPQERMDEVDTALEYSLGLTEV